MSATEIINELPKLTESEQRAVLAKLHEIARRNGEQTRDRDRANKERHAGQGIDLRERGISEVQAADLRSRLGTFAEDWERPEVSIYDKDPAR
jgi:hypothetical protein